MKRWRHRALTGLWPVRQYTVNHVRIENVRLSLQYVSTGSNQHSPVRDYNSTERRVELSSPPAFSCSSLQLSSLFSAEASGRLKMVSGDGECC